MKKSKLREVPHVEIRRTDPRQCADEAFTVDKPEAVLPLLRDILQGREQESFIILLLDSRNRVTAWREVARGSGEAVAVPVRDLFRTALMVGCNKLIVSHNHPSGDPTPSPADIVLTRNIREAGELIQIPVLDHIIIGAGERFFSFAAGGSMESRPVTVLTGPRQGPELD